MVRLGTILQLTLGPFLSLQFTFYTASEYPVYRWISGGACRRRFGLQASNNSSKNYQYLVDLIKIFGFQLQYTFYTASEYPVYRWISGITYRRRLAFRRPQAIHFFISFNVVILLTWIRIGIHQILWIRIHISDKGYQLLFP